MTIDWWTLGLQTVNVVVLVWLLAKFFWRPVAAMIETRRAAAAAMLADAAAKQAAAEAGRAEIEKTRAGFAAERDALLSAAAAAADSLRTQRLAALSTELATQRAAAGAEIDKARAAAEAALAERAGQLALEIAQRLAGRLAGPAVDAAFLGWLLDDVRALPDTARQALAGEATKLVAVSATPLDGHLQQQLSEALAHLLGADPKLDFATDPALLAGLELHGPNLVVANSWRADLERIRAEIADGQ